jgi:hypothetical protein
MLLKSVLVPPIVCAITGNGEGEKQLGQVMMLGANSQQVINDVKDRITLIQKNHRLKGYILMDFRTR